MNYNLFTMIDAYYKHHDLISEYLRNSKKEHFNENTTNNTNLEPKKNILGFAVGTFIVLLLLNIIIYIWTIWAFFRYYNSLNIFAIVASIFFFFSGLGLLSLIIIYASKASSPNENVVFIVQNK